MKMNKYTERHTVTCYETDASWRMKPASFMNLAQEAAGCHAVHLGFGYDDLIASNMAWILSRVHVEFTDAPKWREDIILNTWHKGLNRLFFLRDFILTDKEGHERVKATTSWLVLDLATRRLVRDPKLMEDGTVCAENVIETPADKVQMPKVTPHVCRHTFCSKMAKSGMNPKSLQYIMGHADVSVTLDTYTHIKEEDAKEEMERLGLLNVKEA